MYHIAFYVPESHAESVKESMFLAGAGKIGAYQRCAFETAGTGQFEPLKGSRPYLGQIEVLETVKELKVEMVCEKECLVKSIEALKKSHPYETPAYYVIEMVGI